jgi:hypothetical protein
MQKRWLRALFYAYIFVVVYTWLRYAFSHHLSYTWMFTGGVLVGAISGAAFSGLVRLLSRQR